MNFYHPFYHNCLYFIFLIGSKELKKKNYFRISRMMEIRNFQIVSNCAKHIVVYDQFSSPFLSQLLYSNSIIYSNCYILFFLLVGSKEKSYA